MVLPRKDYELLIEIYSITMAEESVKFMRETLSRNNQ